MVVILSQDHVKWSLSNAKHRQKFWRLWQENRKFIQQKRVTFIYSEFFSIDLQVYFVVKRSQFFAHPLSMSMVIYTRNVDVSLWFETFFNIF